MSIQNPTHKRSRIRKRAFLGLGVVVVAAAGFTAAAFTDFANLNLGASGIGADTYNIQVVQTDPLTGVQSPGQWQEANTAAGVPIQLVGANTIYPGGPAVSVTIPVRNASTTLESTMSMGLVQLPDTVTNITSANYLSSLRFSVSQPATSLTATPISVTGQTFAQLSALQLNELAALEASDVTITVTLLDQVASGAAYTDNSLNGQKAFVQASFNGVSN